MTADTSPAFDNIVALLAASSAAIGVVEKRERNTTGGGFSFRGIDTVVNAVSPEFREHGIIVVPEVLDRVSEQMTVGVGDKQREMGRVLLHVRYTFYGPAGDSIAAVVDSEAFDAGDKATAKAMSVALRTALLQVLMLPTDDPDPDSTTYERTSPAAPTSPASSSDDLASEGQIKAVFGKGSALGWTSEKTTASVMRSIGKHPDRLTKSEVRKVLDGLQSLIDAAAQPTDDGEDVPF